jgi:hypothetical protein
MISRRHDEQVGNSSAVPATSWAEPERRARPGAVAVAGCEPAARTGRAPAARNLEGNEDAVAGLPHRHGRTGANDFGDRLVTNRVRSRK